ncbi:MAG: hypothetical protein J5668_01105 [Bacteroidales bacterium]|nr:hypothetical protein [Bacteroidales bacterium]
MKKVLTILAAFAVLGFACSCNKDDPKDNGKQKTERTEVTLDIAIDGDFADWAGLKGASIAELPDDEEATPCLLKMVAIASTDNVYFYFLYQVDEEQTTAPFVLDMDADDDPTTGVTLNHIWKDSGFEYELSSSGGFINGDNYRKMSDIKLYYCKEGMDGQDRWATGAVADKTAKGVKSAGKRNQDLVEIEMLVPRTLIKAEKKGTMRAGCIVSNQDWAERGILPIDDGKGATEMLEIALP